MEADWTMFDFPSHDEESEMMSQLFGAFSAYGEEGQQDLPLYQAPYPSNYNCDLDTSSYSDSKASSLVYPSESMVYYCLGDSTEDLGTSSCIAPNEFLNVIPYCSHDSHGNSESSCDDDLGSVSATNKRKHSVEEEIDVQATDQKCARNAEPRRTKKAKQSAAIRNGSATSCCTSDNDSDASQESADVGAAPKRKGARAGRGAATDPQSLYARKRRERINEKLRILQNLVPNGTKVDMSTMLEEAVHYVKFLQLQIKVLSSDETWMYAPIAYNSVNIGLDLNMLT